MKKSFILALFVIITHCAAAQFITVYIDTAQIFEHPVLLSTSQAIKSGKIVYKELYEHNPKLVFISDLNAMKETFNGKSYDILRVNGSSNILDIIVSDNGNECLEILGATDEGGIMYIFEYRDGDVIKGFFTKNPIYTVEQ
ncbi:MAG: hypothetical protein ACKOW8_00450 [Flavobacteriales bacterium]